MWSDLPRGQWPLSQLSRVFIPAAIMGRLSRTLNPTRKGSVVAVNFGKFARV